MSGPPGGAIVTRRTNREAYDGSSGSCGINLHSLFIGVPFRLQNLQAATPATTTMAGPRGGGPHPWGASRAGEV